MKAAPGGAPVEQRYGAVGAKVARPHPGVLPRGEGETSPVIVDICGGRNCSVNCRGATRFGADKFGVFARGGSRLAGLEDAIALGLTATGPTSLSPNTPVKSVSS